MPNHAHLILYFAEYAQSLNTVVENGNRFIGYEIISRLKNQNESALLQQLHTAVQPKDRSRGTKHEIWQDSFDIKECRTEQFISAKA